MYPMNDTIRAATMTASDIHPIRRSIPEIPAFARRHATNCHIRNSRRMGGKMMFIIAFGMNTIRRLMTATAIIIMGRYIFMLPLSFSGLRRISREATTAPSSQRYVPIRLSAESMNDDESVLDLSVRRPLMAMAMSSMMLKCCSLEIALRSGFMNRTSSLNTTATISVRTHSTRNWSTTNTSNAGPVHSDRCSPESSSRALSSKRYFSLMSCTARFQ